MNKIVLASGNAGKLREFRQLLAGCGYDVVPQSDFFSESAEETGLTFVENAILKARFACLNTGLPALADDSGIEVDALNGRPGIYSARYAGEPGSDAANNAKLLQELAGVPEQERGARYHAVLAFMRHAQDPTPILCHGVWEGRILTEPRGEGGFGYDPLFFVPSHHCASAELSKDEKNRISHRGKAMQELLRALSALASR
ncbi:XTP/dITP diphosphatase [Cellvibrio japonicus]|uniref:dITP/XTP pyrophosphatase n=1 Tax=Cellvibrio japonicus (strain Ueda107) TaxID=498211 RepID=B3PFK6_CELJU|nr:XTP/dITP diphosphatase [Cellvibrio japonicus]ACE85559.1 non-canonical purine NTP pyrophosphatase, rdgB/HAM1 family [Cellvibrio japonicus Ueda107]QEI10871.1 XTP/dITP diphosphatase [Cellvibrio japonicus]QEI14447.1 XTP/dITP diphosphatase [Cellvibrio japonicus]QEI18025.1 XTP/dITP diphosphatase [Cellvibrio japonicus]